MRGRADLTDRPRRAFDRIQPHGLDRVDHGDIRTFGLEHRQDIAQAGLGRQFHRRIRQPQTLGAHADLCAGFLARHIDRFQPRICQGRRRLKQQRRFADTRIAAHQNGRCRDQPAAQHPVEFGNCAGCSRRRRFGAGQIRQRDRLAALRAQRLCAGAAGQGRFFDDRVPFATGVAPPGPFGMNRAAGCAGKLSGGFCHAPLFPKARPSASPAGRPAPDRRQRGGAVCWEKHSVSAAATLATTNAAPRTRTAFGQPVASAAMIDRISTTTAPWAIRVRPAPVTAR